MSTVDQQTNNTELTEQYLQNLSYDKTFNLHIVELAVWDSIKNTMRRLTSDAMGTSATNDVDKVSSILTYEGKEDCDGVWVITKISLNGTIREMRYATEKNNTGVTSYSSAFTDRATLTYGLYSEAY